MGGQVWTAGAAPGVPSTRIGDTLRGEIGKLYEAESLVGIVPFDDGLDRGTGGCFEPLGAKPRCRSETAPGWFGVVVVESTATGRTKIPRSAAHVSGPWMALRAIAKRLD